ncbi:uncharacterized protein [Pseudorasbora parva]|uniref:uncharacterized protein n=1 Tax=Pseudorasbora parva TaxID=51549 RepID=UPI00351E714A
MSEETVSQTAVEALSQTSVEAVSQMAVQAVSQTAVEVLSLTAVEALSLTAVEAVSQTAVEALSLTAVEAVSQTAVEALSLTAVEAVSQTAVEALSLTAVEAVSQTAVEALSLTAVEALSLTAVEALSLTAVEAVSQTAVEALSLMAVEAVSQTVVEAKSQTAVEVEYCFPLYEIWIETPHLGNVHAVFTLYVDTPVIHKISRISNSEIHKTLTILNHSEIHKTLNTSVIHEILNNSVIHKTLGISVTASLFLKGLMVTRIMPSFYIFIILISLPLNALALVTFTCRIREKKPAVIYMSHLACVDLLFTLLLPLKIHYQLNASDWVFGEVACRVLSAAYYCYMYCSILLMMCMSVDRLLAVAFPVTSLTWRSARKATCVCVLVWLLSLAGNRRRAVIMAIAVLIEFVMCFAPTNGILLYHCVRLATEGEGDSSYVSYLLAVCLGSASVFLDPLLYYYGSSQCRKQIRSLFWCRKAKRGKRSSSANYSRSGQFHRIMAHRLTWICGVLLLISVNLSSQNSDEDRGFTGDETDKGVSVTSTAVDVLNSKLTQIFFPVVYIIVFSVGLPANAVALWVFIFRTKKKHASSIFMANLALADLLFVIWIPLKIAYHLNGNHWIHGEALCKVLVGFFYGNMYCSTAFIACISVQRYYAIVHPLSQQKRNTKLALGVSVCVWLVVWVITVPLYLYDQTVKVTNLNIVTCHDVTRPSQSRYPIIYFLTMGVVGFIVPCIVCIVAYVQMLRSLKSSMTDANIVQKRRKAVILIVTVLVMFLVCFTPSNIMVIVHYSLVYAEVQNNGYGFYITTLCLASLNSCVDPFVYYFISDEFREHVRNMFLCRSERTAQRMRVSFSALKYSKKSSTYTSDSGNTQSTSS